MMKTLLIAAALAVGTATVAGAQPPDHGPAGHGPADHGPWADPFGDATVARADAATTAGAEFDRLDVNHDGVLTRDELAARFAGRPGGPPPRWGGRDVDRKVSKDQFVAMALRRFDMADANHDGQLTKVERDAAREAMRQRIEAFRAMREGGGAPSGAGPGDPPPPPGGGE